MRHLAPSLLVTLFLSGCAFHPSEKPIPLPPPPDPDSPQGAMQRFEYVYEQESLPLYEGMLTSDFRYTFSAASDPALVNQYPNWGLDDEVESTKHLFEGFQKTTGEQVPAASRIDMTLSGIQYTSDYTHADSAAFYQRVVVTTVDMTIDVPQPGADPVQYHINARHEFYLVRGDAAVLSAGQEARSDRWYIRRWDDLSQPLAAPEPVEALSWGELKAARN